MLFQRVGRGDEEAAFQDAYYREPFIHNSFYMREGLNCIRRYPGYFIKSTLTHIADTFAGFPWSPVAPWPDFNTAFAPAAVASNVVVAYLLVPLALLGAWFRRRDPAIWYLCVFPVAGVVASAVLFHGDPRFREPYDFCIFIGACVAWADLRAWRERKRPPPPDWAMVSLIGEP